MTPGRVQPSNGQLTSKKPVATINTCGPTWRAPVPTSTTRSTGSYTPTTPAAGRNLAPDAISWPISVRPPEYCRSSKSTNLKSLAANGCLKNRPPGGARRSCPESESCGPGPTAIRLARRRTGISAATLVMHARWEQRPFTLKKGAPGTRQFRRTVRVTGHPRSVADEVRPMQPGLPGGFLPGVP